MAKAEDHQQKLLIYIGTALFITLLASVAVLALMQIDTPSESPAAVVREEQEEESEETDGSSVENLEEEIKNLESELESLNSERTTAPDVDFNLGVE